MKNTIDHIPAELEALRERFLLSRNLPLLDETIKEARAGEYHDFKNNKYSCGKIELVERLRALDLWPIAERVIDGDYDEEPDEQDLAMMRRTTPKDLWPVLGL